MPMKICRKFATTYCPTADLILERPQTYTTPCYVPAHDRGACRSAHVCRYTCMRDTNAMQAGSRGGGIIA